MHAAIARFRQQREACYAFERLIGANPAIVRARAQAALAAASGENVLIVGPSGSGKQHLARTIHQRRCAGRPGQIVPLACALLGADLLRSTLVALDTRRTAPGDGPTTLLLNAVDQLPGEVQADLYRLRTASDRFTKGYDAGGRLLWTTYPDASTMGTAAAPLDRLAGEGRFRPDLACLLATLVVELPPLAARLDDLPLLAQFFLEELNARGGKQLAGLTREALDALAAYSWPANLDELAAVVADAHKQAEGPMIAEADLPRRLRLAIDAAAHPVKSDDLVVLDEFLQSVERELIGRALARAKGNKTHAARLLGLTRPRLYRRLIELGMEEA